jgi:hypothetical protein
MLHLIHTADWQLGKPYGRFDSDVRAALSEARFDAIDAIGKAAAKDALGQIEADSGYLHVGGSYLLVIA